MAEEAMGAFEALSALNPRQQRKVMAILERVHHGQEVQAIAEAVQATETAADAAQQLEKVLTQLLESQPVMCVLDAVFSKNGQHKAVVCMPNGARLPLPIHPSVDLEALRKLRKWECVLVAQKEMLVVGVWADDDYLWTQAQGEVVEFRSYFRDRRDMAWVAPQGRNEEIVNLDRPLQEELLEPGASLVLHRGAPNWAIAALSKEKAQTKYRVPIDTIDTRLDDLAGLDPIAERLLEKILTRAVFPELRDEFALDPLHGLTLYSEKPGQGKTALVRALAGEMHDLGQSLGFDFDLWAVQPNELKSHWHGKDAGNVRELAAATHVRAALQDPKRRLVLWIYFDEVDSLGTRMGGDERVSSAQNDVVQALLPVLDGLVSHPAQKSGKVIVVFWGLTNRIDMLDPALRRPGRFGDLVLAMPDYSREDAESILAKYVRAKSIPFVLAGRPVVAPAEEDVRRHILQPALAQVFNASLMYYKTEGQTQNKVEVAAGKILSGASFRSAVNTAKERGAVRKLRGRGIPAVSCEDLTEALVEEALAAAKQLVADRPMLRRVLDVKGPILDAGLTPIEELQDHRYLRMHAG
ncbi:MAG: ATP-binding protein [Thermoguttaceae bacterium]|jgi:ATP-dependent 26S proteasome regulatory subunit